MRAGPIQPDNLDVVAAILTTSRKTFMPQSVESIIKEYYEIRDQLHEEEIRRQSSAHA
jgi:hypothetical protein